MIADAKKPCNDHGVPAPTRVDAPSSAAAPPLVARVAPTLVALHGFTQTGASWRDMSARLGRSVTAPDLPGHGRHSDERPTDLWGAAEHICAHIVQNGDRNADDGGPVTVDHPAIWIGYSLGGRVLLHVALAHPELVAGMILISTTAGIEDPDERAHRRTTDNALADRIERIGVDAFLTEWLEQPLFAGLTVTDVERRERTSNSAAGLAASLRSCGTGTQTPLWARLGELDVPTLIVTGTDDHKFTALGKRLAEGLPSATHRPMAATGHSCAAQRPQEFAVLVGQFIAQF